MKQPRRKRVYAPSDDYPVHAMIEFSLWDAVRKLSATAGYFNREILTLFIYHGLRRVEAIEMDAVYDIQLEQFWDAVERGRAIDKALDADT